MGSRQMASFAKNLTFSTPTVCLLPIIPFLDFEDILSVAASK